MTTKHEPKPLSGLFERPRDFVARLILADLIAKRGRGPLAPKRLLYIKKRR